MRTQSSFFGVVLIAVCTCLSRLNGFSCSSDARAQDNQNVAKADVKASSEIQVSGVVLKPDGTPAAGAIIRSAAPASEEFMAILGRRVVPKMIETVADAEGRFAISINQTPYGDVSGLGPRYREFWSWKATPIAASMKGFGPTWWELGEIEPDKPLTLRLVDDIPVRGQVVDLEANPVRGTRVRISHVQAMGGDDVTTLIASLRQNPGADIFFQRPQFQKQFGLYEVEAGLIGLPDQVTTDNEGWFEIRGLGKDRVIHLAFDGGEIAYRTVSVINRDMEPIQPTDNRLRRAIKSEPIFGSRFKVVIPPARQVEGEVVDAVTGNPLSGAIVGIESRSDNQTGRQVMKTVSDQAGRFRAMGIPKAAGNRLMVLAPDDQPYFPRDVEVPDPAGIEPVELKIKLYRGLWIKGRVTDKVTHAPVAGVVLHYYPFLNNEFAARVPTFRSGGGMDNDNDRYATDADGFYRLIGVPGQAVVRAHSAFNRYRLGAGFDQIKNLNDKDSDELPTWKRFRDPHPETTHVIGQINPSAEEQEVRLDLELDPGVSTTIRLVDQQGKLVKGTKIFGPGVQKEVKDSENADDSITTIDNLGPNDKRVLHAYHSERSLGLKFQLEPPYEPGRDREFVLEPLAIVTGRLLEAGEPMRGINITHSYDRNPGRATMFLGTGIVTNSEGRFRAHLIPGHEYHLDARGRGVGMGQPGGRLSTLVASKLNVRAGETIDLGDLELGKDGFHPVKPNEAPEKANGNEKRENPSPKDPR